MQHDVHPMEGARGQRTSLSPAGAQQTSIDVVDVNGGQHVDHEMPKERLEMTLDDAAILTLRRRRPPGEACVNQRSSRSATVPRTQPDVTGLLHELAQLCSGVPS
jgi:hypothetical protein